MLPAVMVLTTDGEIPLKIFQWISVECGNLSSLNKQGDFSTYFPLCGSEQNKESLLSILSFDLGNTCFHEFTFSLTSIL